MSLGGGKEEAREILDIPSIELLQYEDEVVWHDEENLQREGFPKWVWSIGVLGGLLFIADAHFQSEAQSLSQQPVDWKYALRFGIDALGAIGSFTFAGAASLRAEEKQVTAVK